MEKIKLSESFIIWDSIKHASKISNTELKDHLTKTYAASPRKQNRYEDVSAPSDCKHIPWIIEQFSNQLIKNYSLKAYTLDTLIQIHKPGQTCVKRNHFDPYNIAGSPDFVLAYVVQGSGELCIEYSNHRDVQPCWTMPIEHSKMIMFNGTLNYWFNPNPSETEDRIILLYNLHKI
tara:strand:- start:1571 stop:2098 length:528 start_codon:yes stop_codon:yes gene_type:complete